MSRGAELLSPQARRRLGEALGDRFSFGQPCLTRPADSDEVAEVLRVARLEGVPVVVVGQGTRLPAFVRPPEGAYLELATTALAGVQEIRPEALWVRAWAGTPLAVLQAEAARHGLRLQGVEPGDRGSPGGFLALHARLADPVQGCDQPASLALQGVLADGTRIHGPAAPRAACGPDLAALLCGYRGALGVVCGATLKLEPVPERCLALGVLFDEPGRALAFFSRLALRDFPPRRASLRIAPGQPARLELVQEGPARLATAALGELSRTARDEGGRLEEPAAPIRAVAGPATQEFDLRAFVRWSRLEPDLRPPAGVDRPAAMLLERPGPHGCWLGLRWLDGDTARQAEAWLGALDPAGREVRALADEREFLERMRRRLDPEGLFNAHAWSGGGW
jgi:FAD/FMN-containing dehydrogenase